MKIAIFGGSFDPPHLGHFQIACQSAAKFNIDRLIFVPTGNPPHKNGNKTRGEHRLNMLNAMVEGTDFEVCAFELNKEEYSYTAETISYFKKMYPKDKLYFILGGDSINYIDKWKDPKKIFQLCSVIVATRENTDFDEVERLHKKYNTEIYMINNENINISSTEIRNIIKNGGDALNFLMPSVSTYIKKNNLYR